MHMYWRIIEELKYLGENWIFSDPAISRYYRLWIQKNCAAILFEMTDITSEEPVFFKYKGASHSLN